MPTVTKVHFGKPHLIMILLINCRYGNIINFSHTSQVRVSYANTLWKSIQVSGPEKPTNLSFPLGHADPHLIHQCLCQPHSSPPNGSLITSAVCTITSQSPLVQWDVPYPPPKLPFPIGQLPPPSTCLILGPSWPTIQTASRSNQPFFHNTPGEQTDGLTDELGDKTHTNTRIWL